MIYQASNLKTTFESIQEDQQVSAEYYLSDKVMSTLRSQKIKNEAKGKKWNYEATPHQGILHVQQGKSIRYDRNFIIDHRIYETSHKVSGATPSKHYKQHINQEGIRRLTPREFASMQGFPNDFILELNDTESYKLLEKATIVNLAEAVGEAVVKVL